MSPFLKFVLLANVFALLLGLLGAWLVFNPTGRGGVTKGFRLRFFLVCAAFAEIVAFLGYGIRSIFSFLIRALGLQIAQLVVAATVVFLGIAAHRFKKWNQQLYGIGEIIFGGTSAIGVASGLSSSQVLFSRWAALAGCAYVVARGLNNVSEASAKKRVEGE